MEKMVSNLNAPEAQSSQIQSMQRDIRGGEWSIYFSENSFRFNAVYLHQEKGRTVAVSLNLRDLDLEGTFSLMRIRFVQLRHMVLFRVCRGLVFHHPFCKTTFLCLQNLYSRQWPLNSVLESLFYYMCVFKDSGL